MKTLKIFLFILLHTLLHSDQVFAYNILLVVPFGSKSHKNSIDPAIDELVARGHKVTEVAMEVNKNSTGIRQYELTDSKQYLIEKMDNSTQWNPFEEEVQQGNMLTHLYYFIKEMGRLALQDKNMLLFLEETKNEKFDVVIVNALFNEISLPIAHKYNAPLVLWTPAGLFPYIAWTMNVPFPTSYVTSPFIYFKSPLPFMKRLYNTLFNSALIFGRQYFLIPAIEELYSNFSKDPFPSILDIERNASLVLVNSNIAMEDARPIMPNVINVGAMHCRSPKPLPKDLHEIASGSGPNGFIVFSLGSVLKGTQMPQTLVDMFLHVFAKLKQKVIWKFEGNAENKPKNVIFKDWIPQQDLMGHPNCRLAILHGGLNGLQEAVYHGVPVLGLPLGADRDSNLAISVSSGMAEILDWKTATEEILFQKIAFLLNNPKYRDNAKRLSFILKDRTETPAETAAHWIEYVIRHKGAPHLKAKANHLNIFQYFLIDVFLFIITCIFIVFAIIWFIAKYSFKLLCKKKSNAKVKKAKRN